MSAAPPPTNTQLRSQLDADGSLRLSLVDEAMAAPAADEVIVRIDAAPLNPSDLGLLLAGADPTRATFSGATEAPTVVAQVPPSALGGLAGRVGLSLPVGNEGAGVVVAAGAAASAQALIGRTVAMFGGAMFARYRLIKAADCLLLPPGVSAEEGASSFVNPMTALAMLGTMRRENHSALVHTAAASNLGQMLVRLCREEGVKLVNIVRSPEQARLLLDLGATHVCCSAEPSFRGDLVAALVETGATLAFDAVGGGDLANDILWGMEAAAQKVATSYSRYGSAVHKQLYMYGGLNTGSTVLARNYGMAWGIGGWLLTAYLQTIDPDEYAAMRNHVAARLKTVFASRYTAMISLVEALQQEAMTVYGKRATGRKFVIKPNLRQ